MYCPPFFLAGSRLLLAGIILLGYSKWHTKQAAVFGMSHAGLYCRMLFFGVYAKYMLRYWSLQYVSATKMAFIFPITPFVSATLSFLTVQEKGTFKQCIGMLIGFFGIMPIILSTSTREQLAGELFFISLPELALLFAIIAHCYGMIVTRTLLRTKSQPVLLVNGIRTIGGGLLCLFTAFITEGLFPVTQVVPFIFGITILIIMSNIICHGWYLHLLKRYSVTFLSFTDFLNPLFTAVYGYFFLQEILTWHYAVSAVLVCIGVYVFYTDELKGVPIKQL